MDNQSTAATVLAIMQLIKFGVETVELFQKEEITAEEMDARWDRMRANFARAEDLWEASASP